ncbi:MAG TPA: branched-chain amino acid ABC transporter permease [Candidatus Methanoperedenaceae archaeon]|nr:branched-chain amino acid ABC transporter permease [Candidatus Methanoperedenaceae archaeon]
MLLDYALDALIYTGIYAILTISLNLEAGCTGLMNFGKVAFFATGAYTTALLTTSGVPVIFSAIAGVLLSAVFGLLVALPTLRLRADYLAIVTIAFGEILRMFLHNEDWLTGGPIGIRGIPQPLYQYFDGSYLLFYLFIVFITLVACYFIAELVINSPFGRVLRAIRDDEDAVAALGKNTFLFKTQAFVIGACIASIAGTLFAHYLSFISPDMFLPTLTFSIWTIMVIGGRGNNLGVITGSVLITVFERGSRFIKDYIEMPFGLEPYNVRIIVIGLLLILFIIYRPDGMLRERKSRSPL